jgi:hypothetical protein
MCQWSQAEGSIAGLREIPSRSAADGIDPSRCGHRSTPRVQRGRAQDDGVGGVVRMHNRSLNSVLHVKALPALGRAFVVSDARSRAHGALALRKRPRGPGPPAIHPMRGFPRVRRRRCRASLERGMPARVASPADVGPMPPQLKPPPWLTRRSEAWPGLPAPRRRKRFHPQNAFRTLTTSPPNHAPSHLADRVSPAARRSVGM